jgi:hypothetical protein
MNRFASIIENYRSIHRWGSPKICPFKSFKEYLAGANPLAIVALVALIQFP